MNSIETIAISSGDASASIALRGAELKSWRVGGQELMWSGDPAHWGEIAPILFPVVGWTRDGVRVEGETFPLGLHGFARFQTFALVEREEDRAVLRLAPNQEMLALFPFHFLLEVEFSIDNNKLTIKLEVTNTNEVKMPFACGLHPGFRWPLPGATGPHRLRFETEEEPSVPVIAPGGLFSTRRRPVKFKGRELDLAPSLFEEALCFLDARSRSLDFFALDGEGREGPLLQMQLENFPHVALWSRPPAGFLCLEAWTGYGDPEDFQGDIFAKPSMRILAPDEKYHCAAAFIWRA